MKTILLVEDDVVDAKTIKRLFKSLEIKNELVVCENPVIALEWLEENRKNLPGLILLDLNMPKMNGLEFLETIKTDPYFSLIPSVILTTSNDPNDRLSGFKNQAAGYMLKSVNHEEFVKTVKSITDYWSFSQLPY